MTAPWTDLTDFALKLAHASADAILPHFRKNVPVDDKALEHWDPVTEGDRAGERVIRDLIEKHYPTHGIIGEEFGVKTGSSGLTWILDPVDGTRAFVIGLPTWATLIGLYEDGVPRIGIMHQPYVGDLFFGTPEGAWLDHRGARQPIRVRATGSLQTAMAGTTAPQLYKGADADAFRRLKDRVKHVRYGGDAYFFALLAGGHLDIALDAKLQIYDIAGLIPIIRAAGGHVGSWTGDDVTKGGNILAASSERLFQAAAEVMSDSG